MGTKDVSIKADCVIGKPPWFRYTVHELIIHPPKSTITNPDLLGVIEVLFSGNARTKCPAYIEVSLDNAEKFALALEVVADCVRAFKDRTLKQKSSEPPF